MKLQSILICAALAACMTSAAASSERPNIVVYMTDDMCYNAIGFTGSPFPDSTPSLNKFFSDGIFCPQGYVTHAVCAPSRAGLMTGRFQARFGYEHLSGPGNKAYGRDTYGMDVREVTIAQILKQKDYNTAFFGKWHLGEADRFQPWNRGYDYTYGFRGGCKHFPGAYYIKNQGKTKKKENMPRTEEDARLMAESGMVLENGKMLTDIPEDAYFSDIMTDKVCEYIDRIHGKDDPFFLYIGQPLAHSAFVAPEAYYDTEKGESVYTGMMRAMDDSMGRLLAKLDEIGERDNTLIFFLNDNGGVEHDGVTDFGYNNSIYNGKKSQYTDGGVRVPYAIQWPAVLKGKRKFDHPVSALDILPTVAAAAGCSLPTDREYDGYNLLPYLQGKEDAAKLDSRVLLWRAGYQYAVRDGDYKLVMKWDRPKITAYCEEHNLSNLGLPVYGLHPVDGLYTCELYNLADDPGETKNLSEQYPEKLKALRKRLERIDELPKQPQYDLEKK